MREFWVQEWSGIFSEKTICLDFRQVKDHSPLEIAYSVLSMGRWGQPVIKNEYRSIKNDFVVKEGGVWTGRAFNHEFKIWDKEFCDQTALAVAQGVCQPSQLIWQYAPQMVGQAPAFIPHPLPEADED